jgi:hypothetical protein
VTTTVYALMTWAYGYNDRGGCGFVTNGNLISGGPSWIRNQRFEIQAVLPDGAPSYSLAQFLDGRAPSLESMLRTLLEDRFKLVVRRETRDVPVYAIVAARGGAKVPAAKPGEPVAFGIRRERDLNGGTTDRFVVSNANMNRVAPGNRSDWVDRRIHVRPPIRTPGCERRRVVGSVARHGLSGGARTTNRRFTRAGRSARDRERRTADRELIRGPRYAKGRKA